MKRKTMMLISSLSVLLVMAIAATVISFSFANNGDKDHLEVAESMKFADGTMVAGNTNIDNIIENSLSEDPDIDKIYHIVEIGAVDAPSNLDNFIAERGFKDYVIDGNRTIEKKKISVISDAGELEEQEIDFVMPEGTIEYTYFKASSVSNDDADKLAKISNADFVYVSQWGAKYGTGNDIPEEVYNILHEYAVGKYGPIMIDSPSKGGTKPSDDDTTSTKTITDLVNSIYVPLGNSYYTYGWDLATCTATDFLAHINGSMYLGINGSKKAASGNWVDLTKDGTDNYKLAKMLVISNSGSTVGADKMADKLFEDATEVTLSEALDATPTDGTPAALRPVDNSYVIEGKYYDIKSVKTGLNDAPVMGTYGYNTKYQVPDYVNVTEVTLADAIDADLDSYDMIILESDCAGQSISKALYSKLAGALYASDTIVYDKALATATAPSGGGGDTPERDGTTNFLELYYMVATSNDVPRYENVMITSPDQLSIIFGSKSIATCKVIADLINNSSYRGIGGPGASSSMYSVLEIQPCYPIDLERAKFIGETKPRNNNFSAVYGKDNYYTTPADMINGKTKEQVEEDAEYYAWELSKAKIADVTGLPANKINLKQMSVVEFNANKEKILGNYDLVYIGGNISAKKEAPEYHGMVTFLSGEKNAVMSGRSDVILNRLTELPVFTVYSHSGDLVEMDLNQMNYHDSSKDTLLLNKQVVDYMGSNVKTFTALSGYDLTYNNLKDLSDYVEAGMPIIISDDAYTAYTSAKDFGYKQLSMDPDCNMYKLIGKVAALDESNEQAGKRKSTLLGFDKDGTAMVDNNGGDYGTTLTGFVSVFANSEAKNGTMDMEAKETKFGERDFLESLLATSSTRPKLSLTKSPTIYNLYDKSSFITPVPGKGVSLDYKFKVTGTKNYTAKLYIDDDGNSVFDSGEVMAEKTIKAKEGETISVSDLSYQLPDSFFGPLYWKFEIVDSYNNKLTTYVTGFSYVKSKDNQKKLVKALQVIPDSQDSKDAENRGGRNSLWFCTVCQQAFKNLTYNPASSSQLYSYEVAYEGFQDSADGTFSGVYLGKHEHDLGIVKYDSSKPTPGKPQYVGSDDWSSNLVDDISDMFTFDLDIMSIHEFVDNSKEVAAEYKFDDLSDEDIKKEIDNNPIPSDNKHYAVYSAINGDDRASQEARLKIVRIVKNEQLATKYWQLYQYMSTQKTTAGSNSVTIGGDTIQISYTTLDQKIKMEEVLDALYNNVNTQNLGQTFSSYTVEDFRTFISKIKKDGRYYEFYSLDTGKQAAHGRTYDGKILNGAKGSDGSVLDFDEVFDKYTEAKDKELTYLDEYRKYSRLANPDNWILANYDTVIIGAADDFAGADITNEIALADLVDYVNNDGQVLMFHDVLGKNSNAGGNNGASMMTTALAPLVGIDDHLKLDTSNLSDTTVKNRKYDKLQYTVKIYAKSKTYESFSYEAYDMPVDLKNVSLDINCINVTYKNGGTRWAPLWQVSSKRVTESSEAEDVGVHAFVKVFNRKVDGYGDSDPTISQVSEDLEGRKVEITIQTNNYANDVDISNNPYAQRVGDKIVFTGTINKGSIDFEVPNYVSQTYSASNTLYLPYTSDKPEVYFRTNLSTRTGDDKYAAWEGDVSKVLTSGKLSTRLYYVPTGYTDTIMTTGTDSANGKYSIPYRFAEMQWNIAGGGANEVTNEQGVLKGFYASRKASQNNKGIVTTFPFTLSDQLNVSGTHAQSYQVDLEDENMTVWYSLAGSYNIDTNLKVTSSYFAADPLDGRNNYFIYTYKNVNNCGAGHTKVTGPLQDNNDERRLYLNILCNSVRSSVKQPTIYLYDYGTEKNETTVLRDASNEYYMKTEDVTAYPEFSFKVITDADASLARVRIYYDLDYTEENQTSDYVEDNNVNHVLIADWSAPKVEKNKRGDVYRYGVGDCNIEAPLFDEHGNLVVDTITKEDGTVTQVVATKLKLQERYFAKYNDEYTYIVVEATDTKGNKVYQRLKIKLKQHLFNLT